MGGWVGVGAYLSNGAALCLGDQELAWESGQAGRVGKGGLGGELV